jgi:dihydroflavonol-4-reductase
MTTSTKTRARSPRKTSAVPADKRIKSLAVRPQPKTLITGGTGFLGRHLVNQLVEDGAKNLRVMTTNAPAWLSELGVETIEGSITVADDVKRAVDGVTEIYHLAGRVSRDKGDAHEMHAVHVDGTRLLCTAALDASVKSIVMASSSGTIAVSDDKDIVANEEWPQPLDIISRWPYYASKFYQERAALEQLNDSDTRLVIMNPSLLLGPGDERLSSTKVVLDFMARKINAMPSGGLNFVDVRDVAVAFRAAMQHGVHGERYLLGAANWSFEKFFGRLERLTKIAAPRFSFPSRVAVAGSQVISSLYKHWKLASPVEPSAVEMAEYFWYFDSSKAAHQLGFDPRDPGETLQDTIVYVRENFLGGETFSS